MGRWIITRDDEKCYDGNGQWVNVGDVTYNIGEDRVAADLLASKLRAGGHDVIVEWDEW